MRSLPSLYLRALSSSGGLDALSKIKMQSLDFAWVVQVSFLRPGYFGQGPRARRNPGLKSETWATHLLLVHGPSTLRCYSARRASMGSAPAARRAGRYAAVNPLISSSIAAATSVLPSCALTR